MNGIGRTLHEYDLALCDYAAGNVRVHLGEPNYTRWFATQLRHPDLLSYLREGVDSGASMRLLLGDDELGRLFDALDAGPFE